MKQLLEVTDELTKWLFSTFKCTPIPLPRCIWYYNFEAFFTELDSGSSLKDVDFNEMTCLHTASMIGNLPSLQYILEKENIIEAVDKNQQKPLHFACRFGHLPIIQYLVEKGVNIESQSKFGTPLQIAAKYDHLEVAQYLLKQGAQPNGLLSSACKNGCRVYQTFEKEYSNQLSSSDSIRYACYEGNLPLIDYLNETRNDIISGWKEQNLMSACRSGNFQVIKHLIELGADVNTADCSKTTPLHIACREGSLRIVQYLVEKGANIEAKNEEKKTPLDYAIAASKQEVVEYLVSKGAKKNCYIG